MVCPCIFSSVSRTVSFILFCKSSCPCVFFCLYGNAFTIDLILPPRLYFLLPVSLYHCLISQSCLQPVLLLSFYLFLPFTLVFIFHLSFHFFLLLPNALFLGVLVSISIQVSCLFFPPFFFIVLMPPFYKFHCFLRIFSPCFLTCFPLYLNKSFALLLPYRVFHITFI